MNMHVPQSEQTKIEIYELASVPSQIITPAQHKPLIGIVQDTLVGSYRFTRYDNYLTKSEIFDIMHDVKTFDGTLPDPDIHKGTHHDSMPSWFAHHKYAYDSDNNIMMDLWSGRTIFSMLIPKVNLIKTNKSFEFDSKKNGFMHKVIIKNGKIENGVFDDTILGQDEKALIHVIFNEYGKDRTEQFINDVNNMITNWMLKSGFSVGIGDLVADAASSKKMDETITTMMKEVVETVEHTHQGILENNSGNSNADEFEFKVMKSLNKVVDESGKIGLRSLQRDNRMVSMVLAGSKGKALNIGQMIACVGQQNVDGKRIPYGFTDRTLPYFNKYDDGAMARGFVENSFIKGLNPTEFFFHAMGGREGLIDTAVKTSETGYIQRKLVKGMEDARITTDYTVRNSNGAIIQFLYGEDGIDGTKIEKQKVPTLEMTYDVIREKYYITPEDDFSDVLIPSVVEELQSRDPEFTRNLYDSHFENIIEDKRFIVVDINHNSINFDVYCPVNFLRLIETARVSFVHPDMLSDLDPVYVIQTLIDLDAKLNIRNGYKGNGIMSVMMRAFLSPKRLIRETNMNRNGFDYIISHIMQQYQKAIAAPGELVGTVSAQSIGEVSTQMSVVYETLITIRKSDGTFYIGSIGQFIDTLLENNPSKVIPVPEHHNSVVMDLDNDYEIMSISPDEHHSWSRISQISRHPINGGLVRITTINGRSTTATLSHSFLTRNDSFGVIPIKGSDLTIGSIVPVLVGDSCQWETISNLEYIEGNSTDYVYDFTVPGNESFLVDNSIFVHNTLNTFHTAGSASKAQLTTGVPRFKELLSVSQSIKSPQVTVVLQDEYAYDKERAKSVLNHITITTIRDLTLSTEIYFDRDSIKTIQSCNKDDDKFLQLYRVFSDLYTIPSDTERNPWVLRIRLDKRKMMDKGIQMLDINHAITSKLNIDKEDISCMFSDDNAGDLVLRIQCINPIDETDDCDEEDKICVLKALEKTILNEIVLRGVKGIHSGTMYPETQNYKFNHLTNNFEQKTHWIVKTNGTNLEDILVQPGVDAYRTISNDIVEVYNLLGIEAARNVLIKEIHEVLSDSYVNSRHIVLLADVMTNRGTLMSIDRHGINKSDRGPLAKCSFEETPDVIARAAIFGELDKLNGVSANIMVGQEVPIGTGSIDVLFDEEMYHEYISKEEEEIAEEESAELTEEGKFAEEYCKPSNFTDF